MVSSLTAQVQSLQCIAADLVSSEDTDEVLRRILEHAVESVSAQRYLLAVRTRDDGPVRVHHDGFEPRRRGACRGRPARRPARRQRQPHRDRRRVGAPVLRAPGRVLRRAPVLRLRASTARVVRTQCRGGARRRDRARRRTRAGRDGERPARARPASRGALGPDRRGARPRRDDVPRARRAVVGGVPRRRRTAAPS